MKALGKNQGAVFVSAITAFEIGRKHAQKKLKLPMKPAQWYKQVLAFHGLTELPLTGKILLMAAAFHKLPVLTPDAAIRSYTDVKVVW